MFDEASSKYFYLEFLGFKLDWEHRLDDNAPLYCQVSRGNFVLHLSGHHGDASPGSVAYVTMTAIESFQQELVAKQYKHMNPSVEDMPWGKVMVVTDPSQNRIRFCEPRAD
jgi:catechol 2,3-dioxygenase-like lactoylglutathione lyase family enzyme